MPKGFKIHDSNIHDLGKNYNINNDQINHI